MIKLLANFFRGIHIGLGITPLAKDASQAQERVFVLSWFGIITMMIAWCVFLLYILDAI
ncbi:MAG TPA: hypothetical protein VFH43_06000 [Candidatus Kapabacteria bacterium]|nr:hypothetical protein [Candidatus Kapabacteria bacterium]